MGCYLEGFESPDVALPSSTEPTHPGAAYPSKIAFARHPHAGNMNAEKLAIDINNRVKKTYATRLKKSKLTTRDVDTESDSEYESDN